MNRLVASFNRVELIAQMRTNVVVIPAAAAAVVVVNVVGLF